MSFSAAEIAAAWKDALELWDVQVNLSPPEKARKRRAGESDDPLAYIDMTTRQVVVDFTQLAQIGAEDSLTAVLAHEVGHHVRFPHTLGLSAALQVVEQRLMPGLKSSLTNLFFDLQVNEVVGRTRAEELAAVYRGFAERDGEVSPLFWFYLAIYEELWGLEAGALAPAAQAEAMEKQYPGCRAEARMFAQTFWALPDVYLQFVYFCSRFLRYVPVPSQFDYEIPLGADVDQPDADDFDGALQNGGLGDDALGEAEARGWIEKGKGKAQAGADALSRINSLPGTAAAKFRQTLVERHYRRLVEEHLLVLPGTAPPPEPFLPTTTEDWELGESPAAIDWTASVLARGPLAAVQPLKREREADVLRAAETELPAVEVYLDTSGSMPSPDSALNAMTLAALVLATSAIRKKGVVRGIVYSYGNPQISDWMYDEERARMFLLRYAGGGTWYPFDVLRKHADERQDAIRVVISDSDFLSNVKAEGSMDALKYGVSRSRAFVALLSVDEDHAREALAPVMADPRFRLAIVGDARQFGAAAAALSRALLGS